MKKFEPSGIEKWVTKTNMNQIISFTFQFYGSLKSFENFLSLNRSWVSKV